MHLPTTPTVLALGLLSHSAPVQAQDPVPPRAAAALDELREHLIELRRDLHRHPELSGREERTAGVVADELRALGLEVRTGVGGHGVVAVLRGAAPGRVVAFRADMDAVVSHAPDPVPFRSETPGVRHVCGHDVHTTVGVALAHALFAVRESWSGAVVFLFQPAEETARGARAMLDDGALDDPAPEAVFAFHCSPLPVGTIGATPGQALARRDDVRVLLSGPGDLAAAARVASDVVAGVTTLSDADPGTPRTEPFAVARVHGSGPGPGAGQWTVRARVTASGADASARARDEIRRRLAESLPDGVTGELTYDERVVPGIFNDPQVLERCAPVIRSVVGEAGLVLAHGTVPAFSEDFGFFQDHAPGVMFWLGVSNPEPVEGPATLGMPHAPDFVADEEALFVGARAMAAVLLDRLRAP